jgi:hypothetical protein
VSHFFIELKDHVENKPVDIIISDLLGKIIRMEKGIEPLSNPTTRIDLSGVQPGVYLVSVNEGTKVTSGKIVKN